MTLALPGILSEPLRVKQGDTLHLEIEVNDEDGNPIDLSGNHVCMQWRARPASVPALELSTDNGRIVVNGNKIELAVAAADMQAVPARTYMFDLQTTDNDVVETLLSGTINVIADVTYGCD